jgi:cysteinyl-tRNA synthetase
VEAYLKEHHYGTLSGRVLDDLIAGSASRELEGQSEKRSAYDFALWKHALPEHIMQWSSPWGKGFPGWHIECSAMSAKYLGLEFDIHGGGMDLLFPHHECEIAQSTAVHKQNPARYWMHHNMITVNGQKMAKSLNNGISIDEFFSGKHALLEKAYSPMTLKFFILQAHYRGTLDFSNTALQASEKGLNRLLTASTTITKINASDSNEVEIEKLIEKCYDAINEDLNTPILIANLFEMVTIINNIFAGNLKIGNKELEILQKNYNSFVFEILGLKLEQEVNSDKIDGLMQMLIKMRDEAKMQKNYGVSDQIRNELTSLGIELKDSKDGSSYTLN